MIEFAVKNKVDHAIKNLFRATPEDFEHTRESMQRLTDFCLKHPNKPKLIGNLCREVRLCELRMGVSFTSDDLDKVCRDFAEAFARAALRLQEESYLTKAERQLRIDQADRPRHLVEESIEMGILPETMKVDTFLETGEVETEIELK